VDDQTVKPQELNLRSQVFMDRFASNTLRTLGIVFTSIFVIVCCLALLLLALCAGMLGGIGGSGHHDPQTVNLFYGSILGAILIVTLGVLVIAKLAKGIVREPAGIEAPVWGQPPSPTLSKVEGTVPWSEAPPRPVPPNPDQPDSAHPAFAQPATAPPPIPIQPTIAQRPSHDVVTHLSPASRAAIQRLVTANAAQVVLGTLGWQWALHSTTARFRQNPLTPFASGFITNLPYLVLLLSLLRRPGRRAFAYALTVPSILILLGLFSSSATIYYLLHIAHSATPFFLLVPWALHILILYLAWQAIRLTGILPNPARLIAAAAVIFSYYVFLLPILVFFLNYFWH
jgi:hypothetical protein